MNSALSRRRRAGNEISADIIEFKAKTKADRFLALAECAETCRLSADNLAKAFDFISDALRNREDVSFDDADEDLALTVTALNNLKKRCAFHMQLQIIEKHVAETKKLSAEANEGLAALRKV